MDTSILMVDDDPDIGHLVRIAIKPHGYRVRTAPNGAMALTMLAQALPDLMLLDLMLPDMDGLEVCRRARELSSLPIIVLSAIGEERRKVEALDLGADGYLTKPFGMHELLARIRAILRRVRPGEAAWRQASVAAGDIRIDLARHRVTREARDISLTPKEYRLLCLLAAHPGQVQAHQFLLEEVWGEAYTHASEYLHVYVGRLRHKIEPYPAKPAYILTVPGVGYKWRES